MADAGDGFAEFKGRFGVAALTKVTADPAPTAVGGGGNPALSAKKFRKLFIAEVRTWMSKHPNGSYDKRTRRAGGVAGEEYVFCSKLRPAVVDPGDKPGTWLAAVLVPISHPAGATEAATARYFAACHGVGLGTEVDLDRYAKTFGYKADGEGKQPDVKRPEDILNLAEAVRR